jgi:hypothetical protein
MSFSVNKSTQFRINELVLVTKGGRIDISGIYGEINLFDSLFLPTMSGNILINDSLGLSDKFLFDGSEVILIDIAKDENSDIANYKKAFRVYKQTERKPTKPGSESYILHFVSDELIYSDQQRVNQGYETTYSKIVERILLDYLKVPVSNLKGIYEPSAGVRNIIIPNLRPLEAIEWCAKRAVDVRNSPNFMFYQNIIGYNFATLSTLLSQPSILTVKYGTKNLPGSDDISEISGARHIELISQNDNIERTRSGVNSGKFIGFDPITRTVATKNISYGDHYYSMKHGNETPNFYGNKSRDGTLNSKAFNSRKSVAMFSSAKQFSNYIKTKDSSSLSKENDVENWLFQRKSIIKNLMSKRLKAVMPGNFQLSSGFNVYVRMPPIGEKEKNSVEEDRTLSGKYLIVATRHIIGYDKHETIIEVASTSSINDFIATGTSQQTDEALSYT